MTIIGIDLGTTNSLVSFWSEDGPVIIPNALGSNLTPSVVSIDENNDTCWGISERAPVNTFTHNSFNI